MGMAGALGTKPIRALVTGGNRGLGLEICRQILDGAPGSHIFLGCRDVAAGRAACADLEAKHRGKAEPVPLDVTSEESVWDASAYVHKRLCMEGYTYLDVLVNNAGILHEEWSAEAAADTMQVNFQGVVATTGAFLALVRPENGTVLMTSSGVGARTLGLLDPEPRRLLTDKNLDLPLLSDCLSSIVDVLNCDAAHPYHLIPTVAYGLSKLGVNCFTQILARDHPKWRVNACSPGFTNTGMCAGYTGSRTPKDVALGASVFSKVLFGALGSDEQGKPRSGCFFKEASPAGTSLEHAASQLDPWVQ